MLKWIQSPCLPPWKKAAAWHPYQYRSRTVTAISARWLPTRNHFLIGNQPRGGAHECEHDVEYVGMAITCATHIYLLPTCRVYVDKSGHFSGARQSGWIPATWLLQLELWRIWLASTSSKRRTVFMRCGFCNLGKKRKFGEQREGNYLISLLKILVRLFIYCLPVYGYGFSDFEGSQCEVAPRFPSKEACFGPYDGAVASPFDLSFIRLPRPPFFSYNLFNFLLFLFSYPKRKSRKGKAWRIIIFERAVRGCCQHGTWGVSNFVKE